MFGMPAAFSQPCPHEGLELRHMSRVESPEGLPAAGDLEPEIELESLEARPRAGVRKRTPFVPTPIPRMRTSRTGETVPRAFQKHKAS